MLSNAHEIYKQNQVNTASPSELIMMLYNGMVKFMRQAKEASLKNDIQGTHNFIVRVQDILTELRVNLNPSVEIGQQLDNMYEYMNRRLTEANIKKSYDILCEIEDYCIELRETWAQAMKLSVS